MKYPCCCCGYSREHGVITYRGMLECDADKIFVCLRCFYNPFLHFNAKLMLPMTMKIVKLRSRKMFKSAMDYAQKRLG